MKVFEGLKRPPKLFFVSWCFFFFFSFSTSWRKQCCVWPYGLIFFTCKLQCWEQNPETDNNSICKVKETYFPFCFWRVSSRQSRKILQIWCWSGVGQLVGNSDSITQTMSVMLSCLLAPRCYCCVRG